MNANLVDTYRFIRDNCGYIVGERAKGALRQAKKVLLAEELDLEVTWEQDDCFSIGDQGDFISDFDFKCGLHSGRYQVFTGLVYGHDGSVLASLGGAIVDWNGDRPRDYMRSVELELLSEAVTELLKG